ncbi:hypothetical protein POVCU2_0079930 [Plasmodium ovale curtisi]|uniref:Uncharacterized protein n=1 Tax=Plasmodium ovale curtisi TaxID=864141 RepID=A0A1A8WJZ3_PLAOA|nr:hypothetical protein POVCU2_0079930 [Plasmodium ovale curtisi]SBT01379.1 hypothetical protein POVCU1_066500 [Plasmodium ovale curtisi]
MTKSHTPQNKTVKLNSSDTNKQKRKKRQSALLPQNTSEKEGKVIPEPLKKEAEIVIHKHNPASYNLTQK